MGKHGWGVILLYLTFVFVLSADPIGPSVTTISNLTQTVDGIISTSVIDAATLNSQNGAFYQARANHTGTQLAATVSDFQEAVSNNVLVANAIQPTDSVTDLSDVSDAGSGIIVSPAERTRWNFNTNTVPLLNALSIDRQAFNVFSDGTNVFCTVSNEAGGSSLRYVFDDSIVAYSVPTTITLTAGSATIEQINYVYGTPAGITAATSLPSGERAVLADINLLTAAHTQADGLLTIRRWTDAIDLPDGRSRMSHIDERLRVLGAEWWAGQQISIVTNAADELYVTVTPGEAYQVHKQSVPGITNIDGSTTIHVLNDFTTPWTHITNLCEVSTDAEGNAVLINQTRRFNVELVGFINSGTTSMVDSVIGMLLSTGDYASEETALADSSSKSITSVNKTLKGVTVRLARLTLRNNNGTWSAIVTDRQGEPLGTSGGGSASNPQSQIFPASNFRVFDPTESTKQLGFDVSGVSSNNTRIVSIPDQAGTMALLEAAQKYTAAQTFDGNPITITNTATATAEYLHIRHPHYSWDFEGIVTAGITNLLWRCNTTALIPFGMYANGTSRSLYDHAVSQKIGKQNGTGDGVGDVNIDFTDAANIVVNLNGGSFTLVSGTNALDLYFNTTSNRWAVDAVYNGVTNSTTFMTPAQ